MELILKHEDANVKVEKLVSGKNRITIELLNKELFMPYGVCETSYPIDLIEQILNVNGPAWLCDEIMRDESSEYVQKNLKYDILCYVSEEEFKNKKILDFGCGSGASTVVLGRMFPYTAIVGIELEDKLLSIAKLRLKHYGFDKIKLLISTSANNLPKDIGSFDCIILSAVFEHLLPYERKTLLPKIWNLLKSNGILFINQTPYRYFPIETHTTSGMPLINYLPDRAAFFFARNFSKRNLKSKGWETLLRKGIRGGSASEILNILNKCRQKPILLEPSRLGVKDRINLWYIKSSKTRFVIIKKMFFFSTKFLKMLTGITFLPSLSLAIKKSPID